MCVSTTAAFLRKFQCVGLEMQIVVVIWAAPQSIQMPMYDDDEDDEGNRSRNRR